MNIKEKLEQKRYNKLIPYSEYEIECIFDEVSDEYYSDIEELYDYYILRGEVPPRYVYGCYPIDMNIDYCDIIERELDLFEEPDTIECNLKGVAEFQEAIEKFNSLNPKLGYEVGYYTIVDLER